jgi:hypothetical protein
MIKRSRWFVVSLALFSACSSSPDDGPDGPLDALPDALSESSGPLVTGSTDAEVWAVTTQWNDKDTPDARAAGIAWPANSGLTWEEKYGKWLASFDRVRNASDSDDTVAVSTPYGKTVPAPALECAETAMTLRALFASWFHLPFYMTGWDNKAKRPLYAGHFGFVDPNGGAVPGYRTSRRSTRTTSRAGTRATRGRTTRTSGGFTSATMTTIRSSGTAPARARGSTRSRSTSAWATSSACSSSSTGA